MAQKIREEFAEPYLIVLKFVLATALNQKGEGMRLKLPKPILADKVKGLLKFLKEELEDAEVSYNIKTKEVTIKFKKEF